MVAFITANFIVKAQLNISSRPAAYRVIADDFAWPHVAGRRSGLSTKLPYFAASLIAADDFAFSRYRRLIIMLP